MPPRHRRRLAAPRRSTSFSQIDSDSTAIEGFGGNFTEYTLDIDSVDFDGQAVTVGVTLTRDGSSAIVDDSTTSLLVNGQVADTATGDPSSFGHSMTLSASASAGDTIKVRWETSQFEGPHVMQASGGTLQPVDGGGNGSDGGDTSPPPNGGDGGTRRALLAVAGIGGLMLLASD